MSRSESPVVRAQHDDEGYTDVHRALLQAFHTHSVMTVEELKTVLSAILTAHSMFLSMIKYSAPQYFLNSQYFPPSFPSILYPIPNSPPPQTPPAPPPPQTSTRPS